MFGDGRPRCLGMGVPVVWRWAFQGSNDFYKNISLENYLNMFLIYLK